MTDAGGDGGPGTTALALRFASGAVGTLLGSYRASYAWPGSQTLEIVGTAGRVTVQDTGRSYQAAGSETAEVWEAGYFNDVDRASLQTFGRHVHVMLHSLCAGDATPGTGDRRAPGPPPRPVCDRGLPDRVASHGPRLASLSPGEPAELVARLPTTGGAGHDAWREAVLA